MNGNLSIPLGRQVCFTTAQQWRSGGKKEQETALCRLRWGEGGSPGVKTDLPPAACGSFGRSCGEQVLLCCPWQGTRAEQTHSREPPHQRWGSCPGGNATQGKPTQEQVLLMGTVACGGALLEQGIGKEEGMWWAGHNSPFLIPSTTL